MCGSMADNDKQLERRRVASSDWVTRTSNAVADLVAKPDVTTLELEDAIEDSDRRLAGLDDTQSSPKPPKCPLFLVLDAGSKSV